MAITSAGIGSNLDVNSLVSQLMAIERRPLDALVQRKSIYNAELSAFGRISSDLSAFQSALSALKESDDFKIFSATPGNSDYFTATADSSASAGIHDVTVTTLAKAQKLVSATPVYADVDTATLGTGTLTFGNGTDTFNVTIDGTNNTLNGVVEAINSGTNNFGVTASILNDGTGYRLALSPTETGTAYDITVAVADTGDGNNTDTSGLSRLSYTAGAYNLTQTQAAVDAVITVDGLAGITKSSNTISDVIQGVTLNLKQQGVSSTLSVAVDTTAITTKVQDFANAYNKLINDIKAYRQKGGTLEADNTLLTIQSQLTSVFNTQANLSGNTYTYLAEVGVSIQASGTISVNSSDFQGAASAHLTDVVKLFTDTDEGFMQRLYTETATLLQADGVVDAKTDGISSLITNTDTRINQMEARLTSTERRLRAQFSALDSLLGSLNATSSQLLRQLS